MGSTLPPKLAVLFGEMEKVREETLSVLSGLTEEEFSRSVGGEWSAAQILHHILMAETGTSKVVRKAIKSAAGTLPTYPAEDSALEVRELEKPPGAYQAPEAVRPEEPPGKADLLSLLGPRNTGTDCGLLRDARDRRSAFSPLPAPSVRGDQLVRVARRHRPDARAGASRPDPDAPGSPARVRSLITEDADLPGSFLPPVM